jgi:hypothetical protein
LAFLCQFLLFVGQQVEHDLHSLQNWIKQFLIGFEVLKIKIRVVYKSVQGMTGFCCFSIKKTSLLTL